MVIPSRVSHYFTLYQISLRDFSDCASYFITCDEGWVGFSESPSCYLFAGRQRETFQDAQNICQSYGAQLLKIDTESEKVTSKVFYTIYTEKEKVSFIDRIF